MAPERRLSAVKPAGFHNHPTQITEKQDLAPTDENKHEEGALVSLFLNCHSLLLPEQGQTQLRAVGQPG